MTPIETLGATAPTIRAREQRAQEIRTQTIGGFASLAMAIGVGLALSTNPVGALIAITLFFAACVLLSLQQLTVVLIAFCFGLDDFAARPYNDLWTSPIQEIGNFFFATIGSSVPFVPVPLAPMMVGALIMLARAATDRTGVGMQRRQGVATPRVFGTAILLGLSVLIVGALWGAARGGSVQQAYFQMRDSVMALAIAGSVARVASPGLATTVWRTLIVVGLYRALIAIALFFLKVPSLPEYPVYLTTHADSILWTMCLVYIASRLLERPARVERWAILLAGPILLLGFLVNNRRLAWVMAATAFAYLIWTSTGAARRRIVSVIKFTGPALAAYVAVGWFSPPRRVFVPVQALKSVVSGSDRSSLTRDIEDFNLLASLRESLPFPAGLGQPYTEFIVADDISQFFEQYRYLPHNTVLGMLLFLGPVGLALVLAPLAMGVQAAHRARIVTSDPDIRTHAAMVVTAWISYLAFAWGDVGLFTPQPAGTIGIAAGLGLSMGTWNSRADWPPGERSTEYSES